MTEESKDLFREILSAERALHAAYLQALPLLQPVFLQEKIRGWIVEGKTHIRLLEGALDPLGGEGRNETASTPVDLPGRERHALLKYFYEGEERLYYLYLSAARKEDKPALRSLLESHLQDQKRHLAEIQNIYTESLYY
ncbi:MAG TPA: hypothetical protein VFA47_08575 [Candidatus Manganitrophaceae bacterium]|nr:hypothetical protein [Candidatus Manganitrophaceae bacterium]